MRLVYLKEIGKSFGPVRALDDVDFFVEPGEIVGLVGDNAAGKSTLMKILTGAYQPDQGEIFVDLGSRTTLGGFPQMTQVRFRSPEDSRRVGIEMVYQDLALVGSLDVAANVYLGRERTRWRLGPLRVLDRKAMSRGTSEVLNWLNVDVQNERETVEHLSGGQRQAIAIGRASYFDARLVIMDEPTAALSINAIRQVERLIRSLKAQGKSVILISHRLDDVIAVADRIVVLYQGRVAAEIVPEGTNVLYTRDQIVRAMEGVGSLPHGIDNHAD